MELQTVWFFIWGLLWAVFFVTDGFDFGVGALSPFLAKTEKEKRVMMNALGPLWDGNEVWLITAGGVTFAAFPLLYAVMFSSLYSALMLILFCLIIRGVSFEFRHQIEDSRWKKIWDTCFFLGSVLPAILFGVAFANIFKGLPIDQNGVLQGNLLTLLNPYGLLGGVLFLFLFLEHGALWLSIRASAELKERSVKTAQKIWPLLLGVIVIFLGATAFATDLFNNYLKNPALFLILVATVAGLIGIKIFLNQASYFKAWFASGLTIMGATFFGVAGLYPNMFPSSLDPKYSLTAFNASSSPLTLKIMLGVVLIFIPIVIGYQIWAYSLFKDKVSENELTY